MHSYRSDRLCEFIPFRYVLTYEPLVNSRIRVGMKNTYFCGGRREFKGEECRDWGVHVSTHISVVPFYWLKNIYPRPFKVLWIYANLIPWGWILLGEFYWVFISAVVFYLWRANRILICGVLDFDCLLFSHDTILALKWVFLERYCSSSLTEKNWKQFGLVFNVHFVYDIVDKFNSILLIKFSDLKLDINQPLEMILYLLFSLLRSRTVRTGVASKFTDSDFLIKLSVINIKMIFRR